MVSEAEKLAWLWDNTQLEQLMLRFGRALDLGDWDQYRSCLADRIFVDFERLTGFPEIKVDADDWVHFAELALSPVLRHHQYSNFSADIQDDVAHATTYMVARHRKATDRGSSENTQYGWYQTRCERRDGIWVIRRLSHQFVWISGNDALFDFGEPRIASHMEKLFADSNRVS